MGFFDQLDKAKGGFIFLSHSHDDILEVRKIRNALEKDGFEPLCFYLKCLDDDSEIEDLIKREIDAREWFIFVDSENSRKSKWVTLERAYITATNCKKIFTIDLDDAHRIDDTLHKISHNLRIFISYSHKDEAFAKRLKDKLEEKDYMVFSPDSIPAGSEYDDAATNAIVEASKDGAVIALITPNSIASRWVELEVSYAFQQGGNFIPVLLGDVALSGSFWRHLLATTQCHRLSENPTDNELDELVERISLHIIK